MSKSLWLHELQHARPPCPSPTPEFTQTRDHQVSDAIQPSHPLPSPSLPAPNPSQHQSFFPMSNSSHEVAKSTGVSALTSVLAKKSQGWSSRVQLFVTPWTVARQASLSMGILQARVLEWVAISFSRDLPNLGVEPRSPALQVDSLPSESQRSPWCTGNPNKYRRFQRVKWGHPAPRRWE